MTLKHPFAAQVASEDRKAREGRTASSSRKLSNASPSLDGSVRSRQDLELGPRRPGLGLQVLLEAAAVVVVVDDEPQERDVSRVERRDAADDHLGSKRGLQCNFNSSV